MERESRIGCLPAALVVLLLLWLVGLPIAVRAALPLPVAVFRGVPLPVLAAGLGLIPTFFLIACVTRARLGWHTVAAVATALLALAGFLFLDALLGTFPFGSPLVASASRLCVLTLYSVLAAWWAPRLAGLGRPPVAAALGLNRLRLAPLALSVALAALITLPWPLTGALGDRLTSLQLLFQALARVLPDLLIVWGVGFFLLNGTLARGWVAGLLTILAYWLFVAASQVLCLTSTSVLPDIAVFVPLPLLLTELRARHAGLYPLIPLTWAAYAGPLLFMDPRDVLAQGMPQPAHLLSYAIAFVLALLLGLFLWAGRQITLRAQRRDQAPLVQPRLSLWVAIGVAIVALLAWGILYTAYGAPGFHDDGFLIILRSQADLSQAATMGDRQARKEFVYRRLVETAEATQGPLRAELDAMGLSYRPYYIVNMIRVDGHRWLMGRFQGRSDVAQVIANPNVRPYPVCWSLTSLLLAQNVQKPSAVQSNLQAIAAPAAWSLGVTGQGIVVAGEDTGFDWTHPALRDHYRGWDGRAAQHDYNWHDAWDDTAVPFDDDVHGTHTMGTIVGDDGAGDRPGVAPGARWMGCRNMRRGFGNPGAYAECMEFLLAPYPHGGDPFHDGDVAKAPDVVNNSWGCPPFEGCSADTLRSAAESLRAAGIMMVVSAGNEGPNCSTVQDPPANYAAVLSVGATDELGQVIASFSSRGPGEDGVKPDISAPGERIRSSVPGGGYALLDGTSMAGPHVVGAVALVWSANAALVGQIDATEQLLCQTARAKPVERLCTPADVPPESVFAQIYFNPICACGEAAGVPNNVYGCGVLDVGAAVREALAGSHR